MDQRKNSKNNGKKSPEIKLCKEQRSVLIERKNQREIRNQAINHGLVPFSIFSKEGFSAGKWAT